MSFNASGQLRGGENNVTRSHGVGTSSFDSAPIYSTVYWLTFVAATFGNGLLVLLMSAKRIKSNRVSLFLICSLAAADLLLTLVCTWTDGLKVLLPTWVFGRAWCKIQAFVRSLSCQSSIGTMTLIAIERFLKVVLPNKPGLTLTRARILIAYVWIHGAATNAPTLAWTEQVPTSPGNHRCAHNHNGLEFWVYSLIIRIVNFFIPLCLTWIAYIAILTRMWISHKKVHTQTTSTDSNSSKTRRVTLMCLLILVTFTLTWTPFQVNLLIGSLTGFTPVVRSLMTPLYTLATVNSFLNPLIYGFLWKPFQLAVKKLFGCKGKGGENQSDESQSQTQPNKPTGTSTV